MPQDRKTRGPSPSRKNKASKGKPRSNRRKQSKKREEYNEGGPRQKSSILPRSAKTTVQRAEHFVPSTPRNTQSQELRTGSMIAPSATAAQRWFHSMFKHGGIVRIRERFVNDLAAYRSKNATTTAFDNEANAELNRYPDVYLIDKTRVVLKNGPDDNDYVHASVVTGAEYPMICAQGPVESSIPNFWVMVVEQNCGVIVQLCQNQEEGREKCSDYLPSGDSAEFGEVSVSVKEPSKATVANPSVRKTVLEASHAKGGTVEVVHLLYDGWPDRDVPMSPNAYRQLRDMVHKLALARKCTVLIHCSAGIGRTGTFAAVEIAYSELIANDKEVQMSTIIQRLRNQRALAVQTDLQYVFLHRAIIDIALANGKLTPADKQQGVTQFVKEYEDLITRKRKERLALERKLRRK